MTTTEAIDLLDNAVKNLVGTREQHIQLIEAIKLLRKEANAN
jgi:hypothetical protein